MRGVYAPSSVAAAPRATCHMITHDLASCFLFWPPLAVQGHSIGGSLATLLMLMYVRRGVLSQDSLATVYTFGAPAVFCQGGDGSSFDTLEVGTLPLHLSDTLALMAAGGLRMPPLIRLGVWQGQLHACSCPQPCSPHKPLTVVEPLTVVTCSGCAKATLWGESMRGDWAVIPIFIFGHEGCLGLTTYKMPHACSEPQSRMQGNT